ncbi:unnamed protein product, partial [Polarella glacialis]
ALGLAQAPAAPRKPSPDRLAGFLGALAAEESPTFVASALSWTEQATSSRQASKVVTCGLACMDIAQILDKFPEPDAKVRSSNSAWMGGGNASNTACALARLGTATSLLSKVGSDALGSALMEGLEAQGVDTSFVGRAADLSSAFTTVLVDQAGGTRTCVNSPMSEELSAEETRQILVEKVDSRPQLLSADTELVHLDGRHPEALG